MRTQTDLLLGSCGGTPILSTDAATTSPRSIASPTINERHQSLLWRYPAGYGACHRGRQERPDGRGSGDVRAAPRARPASRSSSRSRRPAGAATTPTRCGPGSTTPRSDHPRDLARQGDEPRLAGGRGHTEAASRTARRAGMIYRAHARARAQRLRRSPTRCSRSRTTRPSTTRIMRLGLAARRHASSRTANPSSILKLVRDRGRARRRPDPRHPRRHALRASSTSSRGSARVDRGALSRPTRSARRALEAMRAPARRQAPARRLLAGARADRLLEGRHRRHHVERFAEWFDPRRAAAGRRCATGAISPPRRAAASRSRTRAPAACSPSPRTSTSSSRSTRSTTNPDEPRALEVPRRRRASRSAQRVLRLPHHDRRPLPLRHQRRHRGEGRYNQTPQSSPSAARAAA